MARVIAYQDILDKRTEKKFPNGHSDFQTTFIEQREGDTPYGFFAESTPRRISTCSPAQGFNERVQKRPPLFTGGQSHHR